MAKFIYSSYSLQTAMSHDSKDEVIERITPRRKKTDDSEESKKSKEGIEWETNEPEDDDSEW